MYLFMDVTMNEFLKYLYLEIEDNNNSNNKKNLLHMDSDRTKYQISFNVLCIALGIYWTLKNVK